MEKSALAVESEGALYWFYFLLLRRRFCLRFRILLFISFLLSYQLAFVQDTSSTASGFYTSSVRIRGQLLLKGKPRGYESRGQLSRTM